MGSPGEDVSGIRCLLLKIFTFDVNGCQHFGKSKIPFWKKTCNFLLQTFFKGRHYSVLIGVAPVSSFPDSKKDDSLLVTGLENMRGWAKTSYCNSCNFWTVKRNTCRRPLSCNRIGRCLFTWESCYVCSVRHYSYRFARAQERIVNAPFRSPPNRHHNHKGLPQFWAACFFPFLICLRRRLMVGFDTLRNSARRCKVVSSLSSSTLQPCQPHGSLSIPKLPFWKLVNHHCISRSL